MERITIPGYRYHNDEFMDSGVAKFFNRLSAYEDTGLTPEEIERVVDAYGRGHTLRTESAERLEIVREIKTDRLRELAKAEKDGRLEVLPCKVGDKAWFIRKFAKNRCIKQREVDCVNIDSRGNVFVSARRISGGYIGKTVFLTRDEAEAALAQKGGTNEDSGCL